MSEVKGFARIYQQAKSAMQSGRAGKAGWELSFVPSEAQRADRLVGWYGSADTAKQVVLHFDSRDQAQKRLPRLPAPSSPRSMLTISNSAGMRIGLIELAISGRP